MNDKLQTVCTLIGVITVVAMIVAGIYVIAFFLNQGAVRENKLATECLQQGGTWSHASGNNSSRCLWGKNDPLG